MSSFKMNAGNRRRFAYAGAAGAFLLVTSVAYTQNQPAPPDLKISKLHDNFYLIDGDGGNVTVRVTDEGVILGDAKHERDYEAILAAIKTVTPQPVKYLLTTHYHDDHSGGNIKFHSIAQIISTPGTRISLLEHKRPNVRAPITDTPPAQVVFTDEMRVFLGGAEVRANYFGKGQTNGDAVIYFPDLKTVQMGDMMSGNTPTIDYNGGGSLLDLPGTLSKVLAAYDIETVIPGHGPVTNRAGLETYRDDAVKLIARAQQLVRQGKTQDELAQFMETEFKWAPNSTQQLQNVPGMMIELK